MLSFDFTRTFLFDISLIWTCNIYSPSWLSLSAQCTQVSQQVALYSSLRSAHPMFRVAATAFQPNLRVNLDNTPSRVLRPHRARPFLSSSRPALITKVDMMAAAAEQDDFWQGEWVCADCGYIYSAGRMRHPDSWTAGVCLLLPVWADERPKFEQLPKRWKCPQCQGPKRRFSKKIGDVIQLKNDAPIYLITLAGLVGLGVIVATAGV